MRNTLLLIKNYFQCFLGRISGKKGRTSKTSFGFMLMLLFACIFIYMFVNLAIMTTQSAIDLDSPILALYINAAMAILFALLMTITKSTLPKKSTDEDMLLSLPITKSQIITAKVFYDYLFDFAIVLATILPAYIVYYVMIPGTSFLLIVRALLICLLIPMFLGSMGYFLSLIFSFIASKFKHYSIIQSLFTIVFTLIFLVCYYGLTFLANDNSNQNANIIMNLAPIEWIVSFIASANIVSLMFILLVTLIPFIIFISVRSWMIGKSFKMYKEKNSTLSFKPLSTTKSLYKRELSRYFNISTYVVNTMFGGIMMLLVAVAILVVGKSYLSNILQTLKIDSINEHFIAIILLVLGFTTATLCTTACSISIEGKTLWILKAHPISEKAIFISKILVNLTISAPFIVISAILLSIALGFKYFIFLLTIPLTQSFIVSTIGLIVNLIYPKLDWTNEVSVIKQSMSVGISMLVNIVVCIIPYIVYFALFQYLNEIALLCIVIALTILIGVVSYLILVKKGKTLFNKIYD
ncbi:MAG: hypothetical protein ACI32E_06785 [Bacilli bacterium]